MKKIYYFLTSIIVAVILISNSAQPGIWNAGGSGSFQLLYPEDSVAYKKIQMKTEQIYMQLHNGYAVVKGTYNFYNATEDSLSIKVGYPINNVFKSIGHKNDLNQVSVDGLYKVKGLINNSEIPIYKKPNNENDNWYVWNVTYPPKKITKFTVYFLVNTNNAQISQGYNKDYKNAFIYLIETGSLWKSPIEKGDFYTQIMDETLLENIKGDAPSLIQFNEDKNIFKFTLEDYGKKPDNNFVLTYGKEIPNFNFKETTQNSNSLFKEIDSFSNLQFNTLNFNSYSLENPYETDSKKGNIVGYVYLIGIYGIPILIFVCVLLFAIWLFKRLKK